MKGKFIPMTEEYRKKHFPEGYFAALRKASGGIGLIIFGTPVTLIGVALLYVIIRMFKEVGPGINITFTDIFGILFFLAIPGIFLLAGIFSVWLGIKRKNTGVDDWIHKSMEVSDYPESIIRDFDRQVTYPDSIIFELKPGTKQKGYLTKDYILMENILHPCVIKREDIKAAYLVETSYKATVGNKVKTLYTLNLAIFSNHGTTCMMNTKRESAEHLISLLQEKNPNIDTAGGRVLSEKEYEALLT